MRNTIKLCSLLFALACFVSCEDGIDLGFNPSPELGWIQFVEGEPATIQTNQADQEVIRVGVNIQVPTTSSDLTINYNLVSVSGMDPNAAFSNNGALVVPAGITSYSGPDNNTGIEYGYLPTIDFDISEIAASLTEPMIFDVVLSGTSSNQITVGLAGEDFPTVQRIAVCPSFDSATGNLLGNYILTVTTGPGGFGPIFADGQTVSLTEGPNGPFSREFITVYLPGFQANFMTVSFTIAGGQVIVDDGLGTAIGCSSQILIGGDANNIGSAPCGDLSIDLNMIDFQGGSGGCGAADVPFTVNLTKV